MEVTLKCFVFNAVLVFLAIIGGYALGFFFMFILALLPFVTIGTVGILVIGIALIVVFGVVIPLRKRRTVVVSVITPGESRSI